MTAGRRAIALMLVGILATGIWQVGSTQSKPAPVAVPVLTEETENPRVPPPVVRAAAPKLNPVRLEYFNSCVPMLRHLRDRAKKMVTAWGLGGMSHGHGDVVLDGGIVTRPVPARAPAAEGGSVAGSRAMAATGDAADYSTTNVQEEGVDEPDLAKTDGRTLYSINRGRLRAIDVTDSTPRLIGSVGIAGWNHQILLAGDRVMAFTNESPVSGFKPEDIRSVTHAAVTIVDVSDPTRMYIVDRVRVEGNYVSARLVDGTARIVMSSFPTIDFPQRQVNGQAEIDAAVRRNKRLVGRAGLAAWLPNFALEHGGRTVASGVVVSCDRVSHPLIFAGLGTSTILTIDPRNPRPQDSSTVNADAQVIYATASNLYLAANRWIDPSVVRRRGTSLLSTQIHKFDISGSGPARYLASGEVRGHILKQWSLSEHKGFLRVAATDGTDVINGVRNSQTFVIVMQQRGSELVRISAVRGLGVTEIMRGVRFIGDLGYVVTWRVELGDPLYVIDIRDPWRPKKAGELHIPGFSAYLHPIGKDLLLGIGADGTPGGAIVGGKASLYDVSDPRNPRELQTLKLGRDRSSAEGDHHAFLWWPRTGLAFIPMWCGTDPIGIRIDGATMSEVGHVSHAKHVNRPWFAEIQRGIVVRDQLLTISDGGLLTSDLKKLSERSWLGWL